MNHSKFVIPAMLAVAALGSPLEAAVTTTSATAFTRATAAIFTPNGGRPKEKEDSASLMAGQTTVTAKVSVVKNDKKGDRAFDHEKVSASIPTATGGTVDFSGRSTSLAFTANRIAEAYSSGSSFNYDFTTTTGYNLTIDYALAETDDFYVDNYFQVIDTNGGPPLFSLNPANGTYTNPTFGSASVYLAPGSYELGIVEHLGDITAVQGPDFSRGFHTEEYAFNLTAPVPEATTWAMMILGMGIVGWAMRRNAGKSEEGVRALARAPATA